MQQNKINILSTRPLNKSLVHEAKAVGISIDELSFIDTEPIQDIATQQEIEQAYLQSSTVVFTSMNAVDAVLAWQDGQQPDWVIYCMGNTTKLLLKENFGEHSVAGTAGYAAELAELIAEESDIDEVVFFCGEQRRDELPAILRSKGIEVHEIFVYETIHTPHKVSKDYHAILFYSPSAVSSFFSNNKVPAQTILFAIGNTTAKTIQQYCNNTIIIGKEPGKEELVRQAMEYFS
ncbi:uroporphyrinogen-III synthase [Lacibacter sp. H407]|uniref:uroporphyrinogen-III synthase n=1 Tax=Lacibacter sp. H407 TaxID=3133423 RepID=UPI0030BD8DAC